MTKPVMFMVNGNPVPKQSFRYGSNGRSHQPAEVTAWQMTVKSEANLAMGNRTPMTTPVAVTLDFYLPDRKRRDLDNLAKAVMDACNNVVWKDDNQVHVLKLFKWFGRKETGITVYVLPIEGEPDDRDD